jgi:hypothetical protein
VGNDCSNPQCFKKKYKVKFSTSLILKNKNIKENFEKKSYKKKKEKKEKKPI